MRYRHIATYTGAGSPFVTNISDLRTHAGADGHALYSLTHVGGGIAAYRITAADQPIEMTGAQAYRTTTGYLGTPAASIVSFGAGPVLFGTGLRDATSAGIRLDTSGNLGESAQLQGPGTLAGDVTHLGQFQTSMGNFLYSARDGQAAFDIWRLGEDGAIRHVSRADLASGGNVAGTELDAIQIATLADRSYILAASGTGNYVSVQMIHADGTVGTAQMLWSYRGLGMDQPTQLATANVNGVTYVVIGAAQSSSLTVMRLTYAGELLPVDHVIDERNTRFSGVTALETVMMDGRAYVFAGGGDDGISVFTLLPDGKLMHLTTIVDADDRTLARVSAISAMVIDGQIALFVSSRSESGITQFVFEPGPIGMTGTVGAGTQTGTDGSDIMQASSDTTELRGGRGDDILIAGSSQVRMTGGEGADVFVAREVNGKITITDFDPAEDRIDMSFLGMIRSTDQLVFRPQSFGIKIFYGNSVIWVQTRDNTLLQANAFDNSLFPIAHYEAPNMRTTVHGTFRNDILNAGRNGSTILAFAGNDMLRGGPGDDHLHGLDGNDTLNGLDGNDRLWGGLGIDRLFGGKGDDRLFAGTGNDLLYGGPGNDILRGEAGNDVMHGEAGNDSMVDTLGSNTLFGGDGSDLMQTGNWADQLFGGTGFDTMTAGGGADYLFGGDGNDSMYGGAGFDTLMGANGNDWMHGAAGIDLMDGGNGNDTLFGGDGHDSMRGGNHFDSMEGGNGHDTMLGGNGNDVMRGNGDHDVLYGGFHNDSLFGDDGSDTLFGEAGDDVLAGGAGSDALYGGAGKDTLFGGNDHDVLDGGIDNDALYGGAGHDLLRGGDGNDLLYGEGGNNTLFGGAGNDTMHGQAGFDWIAGADGDDIAYGYLGNDTLFGGAGNDRLDGGDGDDLLAGAADHDTLMGGNGLDTLLGEAGDDLLIGGAGHDVLDGGDGNDRLQAGAGYDTLTGGAGADIFDFIAADNYDGAIDEITDFEAGTDKIDLSGLGLTFVGEGAFTGAPQVRVVLEYSDGAALLVDLDGNSVADMAITIGPQTAFDGSDLLL